MEAKIGMMWSQNEECYGSPAITEGNGGFIPSAFRENTALLTTNF